ncbi:MAG TPA: hypothetical protein EYG73_06990 [Arcobacter sp.]|nr:hypothetical protein [Arcobacter sp.]
MTLKEAIIKSLENSKSQLSYTEVYEYIVKYNYHDLSDKKTPKDTIASRLGEFIKNGDSRVRRSKNNGKTYLYYLSKYEEELNLQATESTELLINKKESYQERDLHKLLSSYLNSQNIYSKTIFHEQSKNSKDNHQKWIHPDMISVKLLNLSSKVNQSFMKTLNTGDTFKITSYEIKKEINTDHELKKSYFQAVSNSSWANYGYLVAFEISSSLKTEMERLNQSFGIGIIELKSNPYESEILFQAKYNELDFTTIDKLCKINTSFEEFIDITEKILTASQRYIQSTKKELDEFCDDYFKNDTEIKEYCNDKNIPIENLDEGNN